MMAARDPFQKLLEHIREICKCIQRSVMADGAIHKYLNDTTKLCYQYEVQELLPIQNEKMKSLQQNSKIIKTVPNNRQKHVCCTVGDAIYIYAGKDGNLSYKDLWKYDIATGVWEQLQTTGSSPSTLQDHTMLHYQGKLYVFGGGFICKQIDDAPLWTLNLEHLRWEHDEIVSDVMVPEQRRAHTAVIYKHCMYVYGGFLDLLGSSAQLWIYDLDECMWHLANNSAVLGAGARHDHTAVVHNQSMYIYGGMNNLRTKADLWAWHFCHRRWKRMKFRNGPGERHGHSACMVQDNMFIYGGEYKQTISSDLWKFNMTSMTWCEIVVAISPPAMVSHSMVVYTSPLNKERSSSMPVLRQDIESLQSLPVPSEPHRPRSSPSQFPGDQNVTFCNKIACDDLSYPLVNTDHIDEEANKVDEIERSFGRFYSTDDISLKDEFLFNFSNNIGLRRCRHESEQSTDSFQSYFSRSVDSYLESYDDKTVLIKSNKMSLDGADNMNFVNDCVMSCVPNNIGGSVDSLLPVKSDAAFVVFAMKSGSMEKLRSTKTSGTQDPANKCLPGVACSNEMFPLPNHIERRSYIDMHEFTSYEPCTVNCPPMMPYTSHDKQQCYKALTTCFTNNTYWDTPSDQPTNVPNTEMMKCNKQKVFSLEQRRQNMEKRRRKMENDPRKQLVSLYLIGGKQPGAQNLLIKPISVWRLNISPM